MAYDNACPECGEHNWVPEGQYAMLSVSNGALQLKVDAGGNITTNTLVVDTLTCLNCRFLKLSSPV